MIKFRFFILFTLLIACGVGKEVSAQYYDWGQEPAGIKWRQIKTESGKVVFPDYYSKKAIRIMNYMDTVRPYINYGFSKPPRKMPLFTHTQNFRPNGIVMLAPSRMELITTPPTHVSTSTPWLKQLAIHEYRHTVQYNTINQGTIKVLSYVLGEQGTLVGMLFAPMWMIEGDAVMAETQMTSFGRGIQPSFSMTYRAWAEEEYDRKFSVDKYFCGSYKDHIPDHYQLGYQMIAHTNNKYGENIWDKTLEFSSKKAYMIFPRGIALKRYYKTSVRSIFNETFDGLRAHWDSLPKVENSATIIETPTNSYTTYSSPISIDHNTIIAMKYDFNQSYRIVEIDLKTGEERLLHRAGSVNTGLTHRDGILLWSEYRESTLWAQRVNSVECYYDLRSGKSGVRKETGRMVTFPVPMTGDQSAYIDYDYSGKQSVCYKDWQLELPDTISLHGLAHDNRGDKFYFLALSDGGMWIGSTRYGADDFEQITPPSYSTLAHLKAADGRLYFNSIASGKDEAHMLDIASGKSYRITTSRYGSFEASPTKEGDGIVLTSYTTRGYMVARQSLDSLKMEEQQFCAIPRNTLNPPLKKWEGVPNMDEVKVEDSTKKEIKKYRKGLHKFKIHSWFPFYFDVESFLNEMNIDAAIGISLLSQNLLNSTIAKFEYQYRNSGSLFSTEIRYNALPVKFNIEAEYGTMDQILYNAYDVQKILVREIRMKNHFLAAIQAYVPLTFTSGHRVRRLSPSLRLEYYNGKMIYSTQDTGSGPVEVHSKVGVQKLSTSITYSDFPRMAHAEFMPRLGYSLGAYYTSNPFDANFGEIYSLYARGNFPGVAPLHSLMIRAAGEHYKAKMFNFNQKILFPRSADQRVYPKEYLSAAIDYQFPVWSPDGGIPGVIYFKRVRLNLSYDYAYFKNRSNRWQSITSYGGDIYLDLSPLRLPPSTNFILQLSVRKPSNRKGVVFSGGFILPL